MSRIPEGFRYTADEVAEACGIVRSATAGIMRHNGTRITPDVLARAGRIVNDYTAARRAARRAARTGEVAR